MTDQKSISGIIEPRSVFVKRLFAIVVVTNLFIIGLAGFSLQQARLRYEERAEITTQNLSNALAGQIADEVDKIDLTVLTVADEVEKQLAGGGIDEQKLNAFIVRHHGRLPVLDGLRVVNAQGENAYGIGITPGARISVADRAYFARLRDDPNAGVVISEPVVGRVSKKWSIILARRVNQPHGSFAGLVYGTIALEHFLKTFSSLNVGKHGSIALRDEELALIARYPEPQEVSKIVGKKNASTDMQNAVKARKDAGSYRTALAFDNIARTYSYYKVSNYPLYVNVGQAYEDYLGAWWSEVSWVSALVALFILGTLLSSWLLYRGWMRRVNAIQALAWQEEAMRENEARYKSIIDDIRILSDRSLAGVYVVQDGIFKYINANAAAYAGYSPEELVGRDSSVLLHPEDRAIARQYAGEMLRGIRQAPYEFRIINMAGEIRWILETVTTIPYEGNPAVLGNSMDVTQFKEAQQQLADLQALESSVLSAIPHAVIGFENRRAIFANDNVEAVFGWKPDEIIGKDPAVFFSSEADCDMLLGQITRTLQTLTVYSAEPEHPLVHRDGRPLQCRVTAARIGSEFGDGLVVIFEDITEHKRAQLHLLQSEKMASIGQLAAGVAHEINNPTSYVSSNLKTLSEYFEDVMGILQRYRQFLNGVRDLVEKAKLDGNPPGLMNEIKVMEKKIDIEYIMKDAPALIHESREGTERIKEIVLSLKNFAHPGEERFSYSDVHRNLDSTLNVVWNELKYKTTIRKEYGDLPEVECYPQQINQVFMNILVNAAQAIKVKGEITIRTHSLGDAVEISISDTGVGIPKENLARIFDPFFTTKEVGKGTGLGLNVAYNIVKKHRGAIDVKSKIGEGTTFTIRLPMHQAEAMA